MEYARVKNRPFLNRSLVSFIPMILRKIAATAAVISTLSMPALAGGLTGSYVGTGVAIGLNNQGAAAALVGRLAAPLGPSGVALSFRPQLNLSSGFEGAVGATLDFPIAGSTNVYVGGGAAFREQQSTGVLTSMNDSVGYLQLGSEYGINRRLAAFADGKVTFGSQTQFVPTLGLALRF